MHYESLSLTAQYTRESRSKEPSLPTESPDPMDNGKPIDLMIKVLAPRNPFMTKPAIITLISEMPDPAA